MATLVKSMRMRWRTLWHDLGAHGDPLPVFSDLQKHYMDKSRAHHTFVHIKQCLDEFDQCRHLLENHLAVEFALWCHDAICVPGSETNERDSALLSYRTAKDAGLREKFARLVRKLVFVTKHDTTVPLLTDELFVADIDLCSLGKSSREFWTNWRLVREEWRKVVPSDTDFNRRRASFLQKLTESGSIYHTVFFREKYEEHAQRNICEAIKQFGC